MYCKVSDLFLFYSDIDEKEINLKPVLIITHSFFFSKSIFDLYLHSTFID